MAKKIFSGVQPSGNLHLGNYIGAIKNFVDLQNQKGNQCVYCVVDLHAITLRQDPKILKENIRETTAAFLASGIDPKKSIIFNQSLVPAHAEGSWILGCVARMGWLNRMTQFKEKAGKDKEKASIGLYIYPILMTADILLYDATHVPVGEDQKQHLELSRDIAQKFNTDFKAPNFLQVPEPLIQKNFSRIMSLKDGTKKMSKSDPSDQSRINLTDTKEQILNKIKKAKTDTSPMPDKISELEKYNNGWNYTKFNRACLKDLDGFYFYNHLYANVESLNSIASCDNYINSVVRERNTIGLQFHPEKSQKKEKIQKKEIV